MSAAEPLDEQVLVIPTRLLHDLGYFQGFCPEVQRYFEPLLHSPELSYRSRQAMEKDPNFKQLIPYVIFTHTGPDGQLLIFHYTRGHGQGEQRLHSKLSVGIGGHISTLDARPTNHDSYLEGMRRELEEEVLVDSPGRETIVGLINDDQTEVGRVHLGIVHWMELDQPRVSPREADISQAGFRRLDEAWGRLEQMESWSRICLESLFAQVPRGE